MTDTQPKIELAAFAGGCFWCIESAFDGIEGIIEVKSGYTGGSMANPSYHDVCSQTTGHLEAVQVKYNPEQISYKELLNIFWRQIDPTDPGGQFADRGESYQTAIFYHTEEQHLAAEASKKALDESRRFDAPIATRILPAQPFYPAEEYHQGYHKKNALHYSLYRKGSGREAFIQLHWPKSKPNLKEKLTEMQFHVTQENGTEPPFQNEFWDNHKEGIYVDIISGEPLFSSLDKFDSGCGWPSFTKPLLDHNILEKTDLSHHMIRAEVRSRGTDSHLGHVFNDGPAPEGLRYCINSAALRFIPKEDLEREGYGEYLKFFKS